MVWYFDLCNVFILFFVALTVGPLFCMPATAQPPFGSLNESDFSWEDGRRGMEEYLDLKFVSLGGLEQRDE